jgi:hypothetical protein
MQFLPATWAIYGHGDIYRPRDAIFAAARLLAGHGAPASIGSALYAYNPSRLYVDAVQRYARQLRADPNALPGYYDSLVICRLDHGWVLLPPGYGVNPAARAIPSGFDPFPRVASPSKPSCNATARDRSSSPRIWPVRFCPAVSPHRQCLEMPVSSAGKARSFWQVQ